MPKVIPQKSMSGLCRFCGRWSGLRTPTQTPAQNYARHTRTHTDTCAKHIPLPLTKAQPKQHHPIRLHTLALINLHQTEPQCCNKLHDKKEIFQAFFRSCNYFFQDCFWPTLLLQDSLFAGLICPSPVTDRFNGWLGSVVISAFVSMLNFTREPCNNFARSCSKEPRSRPCKQCNPTTTAAPHRQKLSQQPHKAMFTNFQWKELCIGLNTPISDYFALRKQSSLFGELQASLAVSFPTRICRNEGNPQEATPLLRMTRQ